MANPLLINTLELLRRQGNDRHVDVTLAFSAFDGDDRIDPDEPVHIRLRLEALNDGVAVSGTITTRWHGICRRCAIVVGGELVAEVDERYQVDGTDPDAFEFDGLQLDLQPMVRELILLDAPATPLCRPDCQGLCPTCGVDRNHESCSCTPPPADLRWSALDAVKDQFDA
jgi:uncharacterized protein